MTVQCAQELHSGYAVVVRRSGLNEQPPRPRGSRGLDKDIQAGVVDGRAEEYFWLMGKHHRHEPVRRMVVIVGYTPDVNKIPSSQRGEALLFIQLIFSTSALIVLKWGMTNTPCTRPNLYIAFTIPSTMTTPERTITVLYFAAASTALGITSEQVPLPQGGLKLSDLARLLVSRHLGADLDPILSTSQWSVDCEMVDDPTAVELKGGEEIGVICPVSGG